MIRIALVVALAAAAPIRPAAEGSPSVSRPAGSTGAAAAKVPEPARDLAKAITSEAAWDEILDAYAASLSMQMSAALDAKGKQPPEDLPEKVRAELGEAVRYDQAIELQASALALRFSQDELSELARFYRGAAGKKLVELLPEVSRDVNDGVRERLSQRIPTIVERHAPSLAKDAGTPTGDGEGAKEPAKDPAPKAQGRRPRGGATPPRQ